jgi:hypothetical protein
MGETVPAKFAFDTPAVGSTPPVGPPNPPPPVPPDHPEHPSNAAKTATVIALAGGALVAVGVGVGFAVAGSNESSTITRDQQQGMGSASCFNSTTPRCMELAQATSARSTDTGLETGLFVTGGALALGALAAWVFWPAPPKDGKVGWRLVPAVTRTGTALDLVGRF